MKPCMTGCKELFREVESSLFANLTKAHNSKSLAGRPRGTRRHLATIGTQAGCRLNLTLERESISMQIIFTKGSGKYDTMDVVRAGADVESIQCPKQGIIPHDMVHYCVESTLQKRGFLGRVRDGEAANFQMQAEAESDSIERLVEVIQGDAWSGGNCKPEDMLDLYRVTCNARECLSLAITEADIESIRKSVAGLSRQWDTLAVGSTLVIEF